MGWVQKDQKYKRKILLRVKCEFENYVYRLSSLGNFTTVMDLSV